MPTCDSLSTSASFKQRAHPRGVGYPCICALWNFQFLFALFENPDLLFEVEDSIFILLDFLGFDLGGRSDQQGQRDQHEQDRVYLPENLPHVEKGIKKGHDSQKEQDTAPNKHFFLQTV
jgi:hypothetical protein